ncbi:MAG: secondary thiamine-phosphate synthase enzyme YjbQ [Halothiobacillaceae bacterium]
MFEVHQQQIDLQTAGRGFHVLTGRIEEAVAQSGIVTGTAQLFLQHTSASLLLCENASPEVRQDMETLIARLAPDGDERYLHNLEGPDDMAAHFRTAVIGESLLLPVVDGALGLGRWQGIFLWEHRAYPQSRHMILTVQGRGRG